MQEYVLDVKWFFSWSEWWFITLFAGRSPHLSTLNRAYCPTCKEVIWLRDPPWKPAKGLCVTREQVLEYHSPRPISVSQVCFHTLTSIIYTKNNNLWGSFYFWWFKVGAFVVYNIVMFNNLEIGLLQVVRFVVSMARVSDSCSRDSDDDDDHNLENSFLEL